MFVVPPFILPKTDESWLLADSIKPTLYTKFSNLVLAELK